MKLRLENALDSLDLDSIAETGLGYQALSGLTGVGLPAVSTQWLEGAGDGATYRGQRVLPRDIDLRLDILGRDREHLKELVRRLALMLAGPCTLVFNEGDGYEWIAQVSRVGGGEVTYGDNTIGDVDMQLIVTLRAGDPYITSTDVATQVIAASPNARGMLPKLSRMGVKTSTAIGTITLENLGDAKAYPVWEVYGPGRKFRALSAAGELLEWNATINAGEKLTFDTRRGTVIDGTGVNRYANLSSAPRFWTIPPGTSTAEASLLEVTAASKIVCSWRTRKWMVV